MPSISSIKTFGAIPLVRLVDSIGDGTGATDLSLNFAVPTEFRLKPAINETMYTAQIVLSFSTNGKIKSKEYGSGTALISGIKLSMKKDGIVEPMFTQLTAIKTNFEMVTVASGLKIFDYQGTIFGFRAVLDFRSMGLNPIVLNGNKGDEFIVTLNDDFTTRVITGEQFISVCGSMDIHN
jgi:hypothetical protein